MDFGKLQRVDGVDFRLPAVPPRTQQLLKNRAAGRARVWVGCPAWSHKEWVGTVYPTGAASADFLALYSHQFGAIELNMTHYRTPDLTTVRKWRDSTAEDFRFCPKFPQVVSHDLGLRNAQAPTRHFTENLRELGPKLGLPFLQLPPGFTPRDLPLLGQFLLELRSFPIAIEFRHGDYFRQGELITQAADLLERHRAASVITDVAGRRDVSHGTLTNERVMVRFVGNGLHPTDYARADAWIARLGEWLALGVQEVYFILHQPDDLLTPEMATYFVEMLNVRLGLDVKLWHPVPEEPTQLGLF